MYITGFIECILFKNLTNLDRSAPTHLRKSGLAAYLWCGVPVASVACLLEKEGVVCGALRRRPLRPERSACSFSQYWIDLV